MPDKAGPDVSGLNDGANYRITLAKYVPDFEGHEMTRLGDYHMPGSTVKRLAAAIPRVIATFDPDESLHADASKIETFDTGRKVDDVRHEQANRTAKAAGSVPPRR